MNIQQAFNVAFVKALPPIFYQDDATKEKSTTAVFELEDVGGTITLVSNISQAERTERYFKLLAEGYGPLMIAEIENVGWDPFTVCKGWSDDGILWYPNATQFPLGVRGQYALPNDYQPGTNIGPYPAKKPDGWINIPPVAELLVTNADVEALLKGWF